MISRRNLFRGLFAVVSAIVLKPFLPKDKLVVTKSRSVGYSSFTLPSEWVTYSTPRSSEEGFFYKQYMNSAEPIHPYIDLADGDSGYVKYDNFSEACKDKRILITSSTENCSVTLSDGERIAIKNGYWFREKTIWRYPYLDKDGNIKGMSDGLKSTTLNDRMVSKIRNIGEKKMSDKMSPVDVKDNSTSIQNPQNNFRSGGQTDPKQAIANSPQKNPVNPKG